MPLLALACISLQATAAPRPGALETQIAALEEEVERLEATRAIKHLQRAYGFYIDRALWNEAADLFAEDGTIELGMDGVYVGRERIRQYLMRLGGGRVGLPWGRLAEHLQLQPVVHVAPDGLSARARWRDFALLGEFKQSAHWGEGIYENEYVKRDGVWMIRSLHLYTTFQVPFDKGWGRARGDEDLRSAASRELPPDRPPSRTYPLFPHPHVVPFHYANPADRRPSDNDALAQAMRSENETVATRAREVQQLKDYDEIENLQGIYGYYFDRNLWDEVAKLFTADATFEHGQRGVYVGRKRIREALELFGPAGPRHGWLNHYFQLQPVIHVDGDGRTARGRWQSIMQIARPNTPGAWGLGVYENEYRKERGVWKLAKLHFYLTALADYDLMWNRGPIPAEGPSTLLPPDRPPTELYRSFPGVYLPPFHYTHPVTGQPIVTDPQPADSVIRPQ